MFNVTKKNFKIVSWLKFFFLDVVSFHETCDVAWWANRRPKYNNKESKVRLKTSAGNEIFSTHVFFAEKKFSFSNFYEIEKKWLRHFLCVEFMGHSNNPTAIDKWQMEKNKCVTKPQIWVYSKFSNMISQWKLENFKTQTWT